MSPHHRVKAKGKLFVISAPSGCGKTTLCRKLLADKLGLIHSVSMTTRPPRPGERDGVDYHFVSRKDFNGLIKKGSFLEYEENFGHFYGTPDRFIRDTLKKGRSVLLNIDVKGAAKVRRAYPGETVSIFILPPSIKALKKRLQSRMTDSKATILTRFKLAKKELACKDRYDYRIINDSLGRAYRRLKNIITNITKPGGAAE